MERTEKIFRALIASDTENKYHLNHGELGFVLLHKRNPDFKEAEASLSEAFSIRDKLELSGYYHYEFYRAYCIISLDEEFRKGMPSMEPIKNRIIQDLETAAQQQDVYYSMFSSRSVSRWMELNNYKPEPCFEKDKEDNEEIPENDSS